MVIPTVRRFFFVFVLSLSLFALCLSVSAADDYPVYVGDTGFSSLEEAISATPASADTTISVVGNISLTENCSVGVRSIVFAPSSVVVGNGFTISVTGNAVFAGTFRQTSNHVMINVRGGFSEFSGNIYAPDYVAVNVTNTANVSFVGGSYVSRYSTVLVTNDGLNSTIYVGGGSFYSSNNNAPLSPIDAFSFPDGVVVQYYNGYIVATSNGSLLVDISSFVRSSVDWITIFTNTIVQNPLILCFCIVGFCGLGVGLIKRLIAL